MCGNPKVPSTSPLKMWSKLLGWKQSRSDCNCDDTVERELQLVDVGKTVIR